MLYTSLKFVPKIGRHWTMESSTFKYRLESHTLMIIDFLMYQVSAALMTHGSTILCIMSRALS